MNFLKKGFKICFSLFALSFLFLSANSVLGATHSVIITRCSDCEELYRIDSIETLQGFDRAYGVKYLQRNSNVNVYRFETGNIVGSDWFLIKCPEIFRYRFRCSGDESWEVVDMRASKSSSDSKIRYEIKPIRGASQKKWGLRDRIKHECPYGLELVEEGETYKIRDVKNHEDAYLIERISGRMLNLRILEFALFFVTQVA